MKHKHAKTAVPIHSLIAQRWSSRAFDPEKAVPPEYLLSVFEAARWAPSCFDEQPWYYLSLDRFRDASKWQLALDCLDEWNRSWAENAPVIIVATAKKRFDFNDTENHWSAYDTGAASENLVLQAADLGLMSRQMAGFSRENVRKNFKIPETHEILSLIALGYPGPTNHLSEKHEEAEKAHRQRNVIANHFYIDEWENGIDD